MIAARFILALAFAMVVAGCRSIPTTIAARPFGTLPAGHPDEGRVVQVYTLENKNGVRVSVMNYGAAIVGIETPDRDGRLADVVFGYDRLEDYLGANPYHGATIGRYAGRIGQGRFTLGNHEWKLSTNDGAHTLHGGVAGFDKRYWDAEVAGESVRFSLTSPAGDQGFPGTLRVTVIYKLTEMDELILRYEATTDAPTVVNLTNHSYFNLTGDLVSAGRQLLTLHSDRYVEHDLRWVPTGRVLPVEGDLDYRRPVRLADRLRTPREDPRWFDHTYVVTGKEEAFGMRRAAELYDPVSGRRLRISTDQPTLYFYAGNSLGAPPLGKAGRRYTQFSGMCLEPQAWPDAPNRPEFPAFTLYPDTKYVATTVYAFGIRKPL